MFQIVRALKTSFRGEYFVYDDSGGNNPPTVQERLWQRQKFHYDNVSPSPHFVLLDLQKFLHLGPGCYADALRRANYRGMAGVSLT